MVTIRRDSEVLAKGVKGVTAKVKELTGLDFDNFCRSVLLPQGRFEKFLTAKARERAALLEALTDPAKLYRRLSMGAFKRGSDAAEAVKVARGEVEITVLGDGERAAIGETVTTAEGRAEELRAELAAIAAERAIWRELATAEAAHERAADAVKEAADAHAAEEPTRAELRAISEAEPLRGPRNRRDDAARAAETTEGGLRDLDRRHAGRAAEHQGLAAAAAAARDAVAALKAEALATQPGIDRARAPNTRIARGSTTTARAARRRCATSTARRSRSRRGGPRSRAIGATSRRSGRGTRDE